MRKVRVVEFVDNASKLFRDNPDTFKDKAANEIVVEQKQCDEAKFILKYLDLTNNREYQQFFCNYSETMFAQLLLFSKVITLSENDLLYKEGDIGSGFWFVLTGKLQVLVKAQDEYKYSKTIDESTFFGLKQFYTEPRIDIAKVTTSKCQVIEFQTQQYNSIISKTQLSTSEKKI